MSSKQAMRRAVLPGELFQLLDERECLKLDIYPREMIPGELQRNERLEIFAGEEIPDVSFVDAAASKLIWISKGSHKADVICEQSYEVALPNSTKRSSNIPWRSGYRSCLAKPMRFRSLQIQPGARNDMIGRRRPPTVRPCREIDRAKIKVLRKRPSRR